MKKTREKQKHKIQSGNALWFILLAVALLGFLTAVISRTGSSVDQTGNVEQARIKASALLRFTQSIEASVQQMILNGASESDLDFKSIGAAHDNPNCTDFACDVFHVEGGGLAYRSAADVLGDTTFTENWHVSSGNRLYQFGCDDLATDCTDLLLLLPDISDTLCIQINKVLGIENPSNAPPRQNNVIIAPPYTGSFVGTNANFIGGVNGANESPQVQGKSSGCIFDFGAQNTNIFYQLLIAR